MKEHLKKNNNDPEIYSFGNHTNDISKGQLPSVETWNNTKSHSTFETISLDDPTTTRSSFPPPIDPGAPIGDAVLLLIALSCVYFLFTLKRGKTN